MNGEDTSRTKAAYRVVGHCSLHTASHQEVASVLYVLYCHRNDIIRVIYFKICTFYDCI